MGKTCNFKSHEINFLWNVIFSRRKFPKQQQEIIKVSLDKIKSKDYIQGSNYYKGRDNKVKYLDEKIKETPLDSYYEVTDSRAEIITNGNLDNWIEKQFELNPRTKVFE